MNRGQILRELVLEQLKALVKDGIIQINDKLKYNSDKNFTDPLDIPSLGYIQALIEQGGTTDIRRVFIIPSSEIDGNGEVNLKTDSDGNPRVNEQGDTIIPSDAVVSIYNPRWGGQQYDPSTGIVSGLDPSFDVKVVLIGGEGEEPPIAPTITSLNYFENSFSYVSNDGSDLGLYEYRTYDIDANPTSAFKNAPNSSGTIIDMDFGVGSSNNGIGIRLKATSSAPSGIEEIKIVDI